MADLIAIGYPDETTAARVSGASPRTMPTGLDERRDAWVPWIEWNRSAA